SNRTRIARGLAARWRGFGSAVAVAMVCVTLGGCAGEQFQKGYILPAGALEQIPIGASQDQVLIVMGTPSTVATLSGEVFYYISQRTSRPVAFMRSEERRVGTECRCRWPPRLERGRQRDRRAGQVG